ncbi:hypothetical protein ACHAXR_010530 [Thalassiosira sp. AJA248-18]
MVTSFVDMPSYNVRHSIANKVAAKKAEKGYTLSEDNCGLCEMPLMTLDGKSECKVCPAIKKWVQRKNEESDQAEAVVDDRGVGESFGEEEVADIRDDPPADPPSTEMDEPEVVHAADSDGKSDLEIADRKNPERLGEHLMKLKTTESEDSEDSQYPSVADSGVQVSNLDIADSADSEDLDEHLMKAKSTSSDDSDDSRYLSTADSGESADTEAIQARARQIILDARNNGASWGSSNDEDDDDVSPQPSRSWGDDDQMISKASTEESVDEESCIQERAGEIINQARKNLQAEGYDFSDIDSPRVEANSSSTSISVGEFTHGMGSWEAAIIIQSFARRFLAKKVFLGMMLRESNRDYHQDEVAEVAAEEPAGFESLGINNPTGNEDEENWENAPQDVSGEMVQDVDAQAANADPPENGTCFVTEDNSQVDNNAMTKCVSGEEVQDGAEFERAQATTADAPENGTRFVTEDNSLVDNNAMTKLQEQEVPMSGSGAQDVQNRAVAPARGFFAEIACKFDDAVTEAMGKVQSVVTCSMTEPNSFIEGNLAEAFEAEQFKMGNCSFSDQPSSGQVKYGSVQSSSFGQDTQDKYNGQIKFLTMNGWRVANASCNRCNRAFMIRPEDGQMMCAACDDIESGPEQTNVPATAHPHPPQPEHVANPPVQIQQSVVNHVVNQVAPSDLFSIEMNHRIQMGWVAMNHGCPYCNAQLMRKPNDNMDHCLACGPIDAQPINTAAAPSMPPTGANYTSLGAMSNATPNANPLSDITAVHYGSATPSVAPSSMPMPASQGHSMYSQAPPVHHYADPREESASTPRDYQGIAPNQIQMMQDSRQHLQSHQMTPNQMNQLQMMQDSRQHLQSHMQTMQIAPRRDEWAHGADETKENVAGDANVSAQINDAKLRIEDAKKFIMSRSSRRMPPPSNMPPFTRMQNGTPGAQPNAFRPQMSMMTPVSQAVQQPMVTSYTPLGTFRPQMNMVTSPGSQRGVPTPQMREMGSLMSPGTDSNDDILQKIAHQGGVSHPQMSEMSPPGTQASDYHVDPPGTDENDGYKTPQMPGKYFFA